MLQLNQRRLLENIFIKSSEIYNDKFSFKSFQGFVFRMSESILCMSSVLQKQDISRFNLKFHINTQHKFATSTHVFNQIWEKWHYDTFT